MMVMISRDCDAFFYMYYIPSFHTSSSITTTSVSHIVLTRLQKGMLAVAKFE